MSKAPARRRQVGSTFFNIENRLALPLSALDSLEKIVKSLESIASGIHEYRQAEQRAASERVRRIACENMLAKVKALIPPSGNVAVSAATLREILEA